MSVIDLNNLKEQVQTLLIAANTTTASTDLSGSIVTGRVQHIAKVNLAKIPIQASLYPAVTCFFSGKAIEPVSMAANQSNAKRKATMSLSIAGLVWNNNIVSIDEDPSDEDVENLMENIEQIIRDDSEIANTVLWSFPNQVSYENVSIDEQTHFRVGIMNLDMIIYY